MSSSPLQVLTRNRDFRNLFCAQLVVFGADWFVMVPLLVLLPQLTGSGVWGALVLAVDTGLTALMLPYSGMIADRLDRKKIMMVANLAALVAILLLLWVRSADTAWLALVAVGAVAVAKAFYSPAAQAALPNVLAPEDLATGNAVAGSAWGTMAVVGASLGGLLSEVVGPYACFWIAAVALAGAAGLTRLIRRPLQAPRDHAVPVQRGWAALGEALRYIWARPRLRALVTVKSAVGLGNGVLTVFPLLAGVYGVGAIGAGLLFAARGAGCGGRSGADAPGAHPAVMAVAGVGTVDVRLRAGLPRGVGGQLVSAGPAAGLRGALRRWQQLGAVQLRAPG